MTRKYFHEKKNRHFFSKLMHKECTNEWIKSLVLLCYMQRKNDLCDEEANARVV